MRPLHKYAQYFPQLEGDEFDMLIKDIKENGQLEPVTIYKSEILDGVNRTRACEVLGIEPIEKEYTGDDPLKYVISSNIRRRHLDTSQRAMLANEMLPEFEAEAKKRQGVKTFESSDANVGRNYKKENDKRSAAEAGREFGVSQASVIRAKRVKEQAPDTVNDIVKGKTTVSAVDAELRAEHATERAAKKNTESVDKHVEENKRFVAEYFKAIKDFTDEIDLAIVGAQRDKFDPSATSFVKTKHDKVRGLMTKLEELI